MSRTHREHLWVSSRVEPRGQVAGKGSWQGSESICLEAPRSSSTMRVVLEDQQRRPERDQARQRPGEIHRALDRALRADSAIALGSSTGHPGRPAFLPHDRRAIACQRIPGRPRQSDQDAHQSSSLDLDRPASFAAPGRRAPARTDPREGRPPTSPPMVPRPARGALRRFRPSPSEVFPSHRMCDRAGAATAGAPDPMGIIRPVERDRAGRSRRRCRYDGTGPPV
jgi:hypothetical protein